jgi:predicted RND superfamily exporter protein
MESYRNGAQLYLGGVPMIADDMMTYVRNDVATFGVGVVIFLLVSLAFIFRQIRWVVIPLICCAYSSLIMVGLLGYLDWRVTVISSNFISLVLIITLAVTIHLVVHYRELLAENKDASNLELVTETVRHMFAPCLYTALTTMVAFSSLVVSQIVPVINFGWMMVMGIGMTFIVSFTLFPVIVLLLPKPKIKPVTTQRKHSLTASIFGRATLAMGNGIFIISLLVVVFSGIGLSRLNVENSFIDYFDSSTEIYQGMSLIDKELGGTTPLEVIVKLGNTEEEEATSTEDPDEAFFDDSDFGDDFEAQADNDPGTYWFTQGKVAKIHEIHDFINELEQTGKVLSISTMMRIAEGFNENEALTNLELVLVYKKLPKEYHDIIINPYISFEENEARFSIRVKDSNPNLQRDTLLKTIHQGLTGKLGFAEEDVHLSGMLVMYNNMLKSLFKSQILTLGVVLLGIFLMFMLLFRSVTLGILGIMPNILSAATVLAVMGWAGIPLDMMTITIAAITVGIGVDDTIHYIHRFGKEIIKDGDYDAALMRTHGSIGNAMYYTSITIILGFSILTLSNFVPTIYFGLLTGLAMFIALVANLTLLPQLIRFFKPFDKEKESLN